VYQVEDLIDVGGIDSYRTLLQRVRFQVASGHSVVCSSLPQVDQGVKTWGHLARSTSL